VGPGTIEIFNLTAKFSDTPGSIQSPPPHLSEHTETILSELGYSAAEQQELRRQSII
jgi:crotonobetainyl-CoA:carnitine CoA-transferase CaiB-like acyl-CoA transferase